jgi:hypothetical protein
MVARSDPRRCAAALLLASVACGGRINGTVATPGDDGGSQQGTIGELVPVDSGSGSSASGSPGSGVSPGSPESSSVAEVRGTAGGQAFASHGAIGVSTQAASDPSVPNFVTIGIPANLDLTCAQEKQNTSMNIDQPSRSILAFGLSAGGTPLVTGTYIVASNDGGDAGGMTASGAYTATDANCGRVFQEMVTGGSVTVTAVDRTAISGSFELSFPSGDQLDGQFDAPLCYVYVRGYGAIVSPPPTCSH